MSLRLARIMMALLLLSVLSWGCASGGASEKTEEAPPQQQEEAADEEAPVASPPELPLVIEPVPGQRASSDDPEAAKQVEAEIEALRAAVAANPDDPAAHRSLARALHSAKRRDESIPHFERAAELDPGVRSLLDLALAYNSVSLIAEAQGAYHKLLELSPENPLALHNLGAIASKRGELDEAISYYRRALAADPEYLMAQFHMANALERSGQYKEAYKAFARVLDLEPTTSVELGLFDDALYRMASLDMNMGAYPRAAELLVELLNANPDHGSAHYLYGQVLLQLGRVEEAQREFEAHMRVLAQQHPDSAVAMGE